MSGHDPWCRAADPVLRDSSMAGDCICERLAGVRADLRAKVEALPVIWLSSLDSETATYRRDDVLALIDGGGDE